MYWRVYLLNMEPEQTCYDVWLRDSVSLYDTQKAELEETEMTMLRCSLLVTRMDRIRTDQIRR